MSPDIWTRCGGSSSLRRLASSPWRVVESQQRSSTRQLVDSDREHELLERHEFPLATFLVGGALPMPAA